MLQQRSGWLTILPSGKWFIQLPRQALGKRSQKKLFASLGPFSHHKRVYTGLLSNAARAFSNENQLENDQQRVTEARSAHRHFDRW